jgi:hypothetical protein
MVHKVCDFVDRPETAEVIVNSRNSTLGHGAYKGGLRYKCKACGGTFTERTRLRTPKYIAIISPGGRVMDVYLGAKRGKQGVWVIIDGVTKLFIAFYVGSRVNSYHRCSITTLSVV